MNKKRLGGVLTVCGLILCLAALGLTGYNLWEDIRAENTARSVLDRIVLPETGTEAADDDDAGSDDMQPLPEYMSDADREMPAQEIDGYLYIGVLEIPRLELELPIMDRWDYTRMKIAPCRYAGSVYRSDMIIAAHNYASHFGSLQELNGGDEIFFTDMDGNVFVYTVSLIETLDGTAVEEMENGEWDLTLFTCTFSGQARVTVRCMLKAE